MFVACVLIFHQNMRFIVVLMKDLDKVAYHLVIYAIIPDRECSKHVFIIPV